MPSSPTMKYCPDCNAPNPQARTECFACGQPLQPKTAPPSPPSQTAPGRPLPPARLPPGWNAETFPDGTVRLRRTTGGRLLRDAGLPCGLVGGAFIVGASGAWLQGVGIVAVVFVGGISFALLCAGIAAFVWLLASQEEFRMGPQFLARRQFLGNYEQTWRVEGPAALCISTHKVGADWGRYGTEEKTRKLYVEHGAQQQPIDQSTGDARQYGMTWRTGAGMLSDAMGGQGDDAMLLLARYLSAKTGWLIWDDQAAAAGQSPRRG